MTMVSLLLSMLLAINQRPKVVRNPLESKARDFVSYFTTAKFDMASKDFNEEMRETVTPAVLAEMKRQSDYYLGDFRSIVMVRQRREGSFRMVEIVCRFDKSLGAFRVAFDALDSIGALHIEAGLHDEVEKIFGLGLPVVDWTKEEGIADEEVPLHGFR